MKPLRSHTFIRVVVGQPRSGATLDRGLLRLRGQVYSSEPVESAELRIDGEIRCRISPTDRRPFRSDAVPEARFCADFAIDHDLRGFDRGQLAASVRAVDRRGGEAQSPTLIFTVRYSPIAVFSSEVQGAFRRLARALVPLTRRLLPLQRRLEGLLSRIWPLVARLLMARQRIMSSSSPAAKIPFILLFCRPRRLRRPGRRTRRRFDLRLERVPSLPRFTVLVLPTDPEADRLTIESIANLHYPRVEVILVDPAGKRETPWPENGWTVHRVASIEDADRIVQRSESRYVTAIVGGDTLAPEACLRFAEALARRPDADCLYADEAFRLGASFVFAPYYKPDWSPEIQWAQPWFLGLTFCLKEVWLRARWAQDADRGAGLIDLAFRITEEASCIVHVTDVLYHRPYRLDGPSPDVASLSPQARKPLVEALARQNLRAQVAPDPGAGVFRISLTPQRIPDVSIVIPTRDRVELLRACVDSVLEKTDYPDFEIRIVDNGSRLPETIAQLEAWTGHPRIRIQTVRGPFNFSRLNNAAVSAARSPLVLLLNNDTEVIRPDWLSQMVALIERPGIGAVGAKLYYPNHTIQHSGVVIGLSGLANHPFRGFPRAHPGYRGLINSVRGLSCVTAACLLIRREIYREVGGLDERFPGSFGDVDLCLGLITRGYRIVYTPQAELVHHESASRGFQGLEDTDTRRAFRLIRERWSRHWMQDRFYHDRLALTNTRYTCR